MDKRRAAMKQAKALEQIAADIAEIKEALARLEKPAAKTSTRKPKAQK